jgi:deoxyribose-phosphate aldolase
MLPAMKYTYAQLAGMIDHSLLHPTMTDKEIEDGCRLALKYQVASVCVKPYSVRQAAQLLAGTPVRVGCVIGFPHGSNTTECKRYETELACKDGAVEVDMVMNIGRAMTGDWGYVEQDIRAVCDEAHKHGAKVKVIIETDFLGAGGAGLSGDELKTKVCELCEGAGTDWVKTSTGFGFVKQKDGNFNYKGATEHDVSLMRRVCSEKVQVKASGGVRDLDGLIRVRDLGASRCGTSATAMILDEYNRRESGGTAEGERATGGEPRLGGGGY